MASLIALSALLLAPHLHGRLLDFRAFYCAGQVQLSGVDPYREHPLRECEERVSAPGLSAEHFGTSVPAPFPGFVLALFAMLALVPFAWSLVIWESAACLALGLAVVLVARTTRTSLTASAIGLGFPAVVVALQLGQVTPFILLAVAGSASLLGSGRPRLAAVASLGALLDPHVGLALYAGIFVGVPRARGVLLAGAAALAALGLFVSGPAREWEYLHAVIPAHALANLTDAAQFSTSNFAFEAGAPVSLALILGSLWYAGAIIAGVCVALRLRTRLGIAAVAYVPTAFAVFGGTHTHIWQLAIAVPAFMLLHSAAGARRDVCAVVTFIAAMPWLALAPFPWLFAIPTALAVLFAREMGCGRQGIRLAAGTLSALLVIMTAILRTPLRKLADVNVPGNPLAEVPWQIAVVARNVPADAWHFIARAPTAIAFALLLAGFVQAVLVKESIVIGEC